MVIMVFFHEDKEKREALLRFIAGKFPEVTSLMYIINEKKNDSLGDQEPILYKGEDHLYERMDGLKFRIGPKSFYQTNTLQAAELYRTALGFADLKGDEIVYDLYTGTGTIANFVAPHVKKVIGIEYVDEAIKDARVNSELNNIKNAEFFTGDMKDILSDEFIKANGQPDVIITDPPRAGMHEDVVKVIIKADPEKIVYVSCNPATQARDINLLSEKYDLTAIQPVDMFPHTHHVENVVLLTRKKTDLL
jgi:23S rRNA (uracil1939-C5)-methyltransferase